MLLCLKLNTHDIACVVDEQYYQLEDKTVAPLLRHVSKAISFIF
jgi:hypothetical protein